MEAAHQLLTLAELSVVFAGFAGIIATFQFNKPEGVSRGQIITLTLILVVAFSCLFCSLLPLVLYNFGLSEQTIWMIVSFIGGVIWFAALYWVFCNTRALRKSTPDHMKNLFLCFLALIQVTVLMMNSFGIYFDREFGPFFAAFIFGFFLICSNFSTLLLRPLWRASRLKAASGAAEASAFVNDGQEAT